MVLKVARRSGWPIPAFVLVMVFLGLFSIPVVAAEKFPVKPIELVAWAKPGGGSDIFCRSLAKSAEKVLPVPLVVINKAGGSGAVGMAYEANQPADGYTVLAVTSNLVLTPNTGGSQQTYRDFVPIIRVGIDLEVLYVRTDSPYKTVKDLLEDAARRPGQIKFGLFGTGTIDHLVAYSLSKQAKVKFSYIPFTGGGEVMTSLLGGHVDAIVGNPGEVAAQVEAKQIRPLAVASGKRTGAFPEVPTFTELGYPIVYEQLRGLVAPKGTPPEVVKALHDMFKKVMEQPSFVNYMKGEGIEPAYMNGDDFLKFIANEDRKAAETLEDLGLKKK